MGMRTFSYFTTGPEFPRAPLYRVTPSGCRVLNAAISVHDHQFPAAYLAAA
jgi:hypothetical protein